VKYKVAQKELQKAFDSQKTISIPKLKRLFQSLNLSVKEPLNSDNQEKIYLKREIKKLRKENNQLKRRLKNELKTIV
jgi:hypothetical protein